jgi:hypothetical protein
LPQHLEGGFTRGMGPSTAAGGQEEPFAATIAIGRYASGAVACARRLAKPV